MADSIYVSYNASNNKEDLTNVLVEIGQMDNPVFSGLSKTKAKGRYHETSTYDYASAATNAGVEGADFESAALTSPSVSGNYTQIFKKVFRVSETQRAVDTAGYADEYAWRVKVALKEIGRDIEKALITGTANSGASGTGRRLKGILATITEEIATGTGTGRTLKESEMNSFLQGIHENGGNPDWLVGSFRQKVAIAELASSNRRFGGDSDKFVSNVAYYESPFGILRVSGDAQMSADTLCALEKETWAIAELRPLKKEDLAKTSDSMKGAVVGELTLEAKAQKYNGKMTGLKTS